MINTNRIILRRLIGSGKCLRRPAGLLILLIIVVWAPLIAQRESLDQLQRGFESPPNNSRIMMRWWWFGPSVVKPEIEREMRLMKEGGIGGFEVQPTYPLSPDDAKSGFRNFPFLSDEYLDALRFTSQKAQELGLRMDLTLGSGWPFGGAQVPITDAAGMLRTERVKLAAGQRRVPLPAIGAGEKLIAVFLATLEGSKIKADSSHEVTDIRDGAVWLDGANTDSGELLFFISSHTGMQVKRPAFGAEGFVLDHLSKTATENYLHNVGDKLMTAFGNVKPYAIFCDSLEVYGQDWTDDLLAEFRQRRGYDLKPYLPALVSDQGPETESVRYDWGRTLTELLNERFVSTVHDWSRKNQTLFRIQNYGIPGAAISSNKFEDLPEGEGPQWKVLRAARWASSASHIYGRPVTSSETWTWLHSPVFRATPLDMKAEADLHFLEGVNQLIGHGWPYTPPQIEYPGWRFYASAVFDEKNPWWLVMPDIAQYMARLSYVLRQGEPANDVALYLSNSDAWAHFSAGHTHLIETEHDLLGSDVMPEILDSGYNLDFFDDQMLDDSQGKAVPKEFAVGQMKYRVVVLPGVEYMPLATLKRLEEFVSGGGILIATRRLPSTIPGMKVSAEDQQQFREIISRLFEGPEAKAHFVSQEKGGLRDTLKLTLKPDFATDASNGDLGFVHRSVGDSDVYFIANTSNTPRTFQATFRIGERNAEIWNPLSGHIAKSELAGRSSDSTSIKVALEPYGSRVVVLTSRNLPGPVTTPENNGPASYIDLSNGWNVTFESTGQKKVFDRLDSWTVSDDTKFYSGKASYEKTFEVAPGPVGKTFVLDFGQGSPIEPQTLKAGMQAWFDPPVREAAVVFVNGQRAGSLWCPPYKIDLTGLLKTGQNSIRIEVANLAVNFMAGRRSPDYRLLNLRYGERFQAQDMDKIQPEPSGLVGKIRLVAR